MRRGINDVLLGQILIRNESRENLLSEFATKSSDGIRRIEEPDEVRSKFFRDSDRIIHSKAYTRYIDKTQVFYLFENDHITHRVLHVQLVSKIARQIGRALDLNEDLIEAIALGHDIGHAPYGHEGETYLSELCQSHGIGEFHHNVQSVQFLDKIENQNLTLQVLDGILSHDGESYNQVLTPNRNKSWDILDKEIEAKINENIELTPMGLEGCVVRISDMISFVGRDIEDAITVGLITREQVPESCAEVICNNNRDIINTLVIDIIENSYGMDFIKFSSEVWQALEKLRDFNMEMIYTSPRLKTQSAKIKRMYEFMYETFLNDLKSKNLDSNIYNHHINYYKTGYSSRFSEPEIVRDFLAGMTDKYFNNTFKELFLPKKCRYNIEECEKFVT
ncbi:MAG: HD domain-containing protein [ANME-2 cluster archaeon]|nr:HD domain-containing protein [ANME-2 cluster archaeon]MBC2700267.1 HD domain-containing protein [ANME-2 cluster archaeon]MBC2708009.1 HD domain-containing protein [ANME-2 cluster archaeon]MBC2747812.1 HD domain-containing protein [ANME-2 cluster archaeon]